MTDAHAHNHTHTPATELRRRSVSQEEKAGATRLATRFWVAAAHSHENSRRNAHAVVRKKARTTLAVPSPPLRSQPHPAGHNPRRAAAVCGLSPTGAVLAAHAPSQCGRATTFGAQAAPTVLGQRPPPRR